MKQLILLSICVVCLLSIGCQKADYFIGDYDFKLLLGKWKFERAISPQGKELPGSEVNKKVLLGVFISRNKFIFCDEVAFNPVYKYFESNSEIVNVNGDISRNGVYFGYFPKRDKINNLIVFKNHSDEENNIASYRFELLGNEELLLVNGYDSCYIFRKANEH